jgi:polyisoprenoid-binding protein YceI
MEDVMTTTTIPAKTVAERAASPTTWTIDRTHSAVGFAVRHMVMAKVRGRFTQWDGTIHIDEAAPERSSVEVEIAADSIDTGMADRDAHLRSADFFDVAAFPAITFKSRRIEREPDERFRVVGDLTVHGVTREVVLQAEDHGRGTDPWGGQRAGFSAKTTIDRRDFGLKWNQLLETGGVLVGEKVEIELEVQAVRATAAPQA